MKDSMKETLTVFALVIAVGLMCGGLGIIGGIAIGENRSVERLSGVPVVVDIDTLLLDSWQLDIFPVEVIMPQIKIRYKIKLREDK